MQNAPHNVPAFVHLRVSWPLARVAEVALRREPVNAMNLALWAELETVLAYVETLYPAHTRALVLSSALSRAVFTAGNDLRELHAPSTSRPRFTKFWLTSTRAITRLYATPLITVCAIRGACPAGGCILALCCESRIVSSDAVIGLNEAAIGIGVPKYWAKLFIHTSNNVARAERALLEGTLLAAEQALTLGLVDSIDANPRDVAIAQAHASIARSNASGRALAKSNLRAHFAEQWNNSAHDEANEAWQSLQEAHTASAVGRLLKRRTRGSKL